jgi:hypothetical protein
MFVWKILKTSSTPSIGIDLHNSIRAVHNLHVVKMEISKIWMCKWPLTYFCHESCRWMASENEWMNQDFPCPSFLKLKKELGNGVSWADFVLSIQKRPWSPPRGPPKGQTKTTVHTKQAPANTHTTMDRSWMIYGRDTFFSLGSCSLAKSICSCAPPYVTLFTSKFSYLLFCNASHTTEAVKLKLG